MANINVETPYGNEIVPFHGQGATNPKGWLMLLPTGNFVNKITYPDFPAVTDITYLANIWDIEVSGEKSSRNTLCLCLAL